ncbi:hypothetical protein V8E54_007022 [Elaphomyces granulatus]
MSTLQGDRTTSGTPPSNDATEEVKGLEYEEYEEYGEDVEDEEEGVPDTGGAQVIPGQSTSGQSTPGKVFIPAPVLAMPMRSPQTELVTAKNTFEVTGAWTPGTLSSIRIIYPTLSSEIETTNDLTRENNPEKRFRKGALTFRYGNWTSDTIRFNNVAIPSGKGGKYGTSFVNVALPGFAAEIFSAAGKKTRPTIVNEKALQPDTVRWWKTVNGLEGKFGKVSTAGVFEPISLEALVGEMGGRGVIVNVVGRFYAKASTDNRQNIGSVTPQTLQFEVDRMFLVGISSDIEPPVRMSMKKDKPIPAMVKADIATDKLLQDLAALGL